MNKPGGKAAVGYFALPVLHEDQLVGKLDATADRKTGILQVHAIHEDVPVNPGDRKRRARRGRGPGRLARLEVAGH